MRTRKGFTLIEIVIYTAIASMMLISMVLITQSLYQTRARVRSAIILEENMRHAMARIIISIRESEGVAVPGIHSTGTYLSLAMPNPTIDPTQFDLVDGTIVQTSGVGSGIPITSPQVEITDLEFTRSSTTIPLVFVEMSGQLRNVVGAYQSELTLSNSATIRR
ncbi:hypothetical protein GF380_02885 [Candidatus Uhrbacteria bacterium]|nr:hypothetical protein [Candidatus Uhrbacteria bacterium]MBD3284095.1 hypothetical protein [Candidatus Uhrbacteria bacterium]